MYLSELVTGRLSSVGLSKRNILAAGSDGASNVLFAVDLMGFERQKCFAHGLDLIVKKVIYGKQALAYDFDVGILEEEEEDYEDSGEESDEEDDAGGSGVTLGEAVDRLRLCARQFKPNMMDEIRRTTEKEEFNGKELRPILDCRTRWYSTLLMIERALRIRCALNNVLARHSTPITSVDLLALESIATVLAPFKRAILLLCKEEANLLHADRIFVLLLQELERVQSRLARLLLETLKDELRKRRTILSSIIAMLEELGYDFQLESAIQVQPPSDEEVLDKLAAIVDAESEFDFEDSTDPISTESPVSSSFHDAVLYHEGP